MTLYILYRTQRGPSWPGVRAGAHAHGKFLAPLLKNSVAQPVSRDGYEKKVKQIILNSINAQKDAKKQRTTSHDKFKSLDKANRRRRQNRRSHQQVRAVSKAAKKKNRAAQPVRKKLKQKKNARLAGTCRPTVVAGACKPAGVLNQKETQKVNVLQRAKMPPSQRHLNQKYFVRFLFDLPNLTYKHGGIQKTCPPTANKWGGQRA